MYVDDATTVSSGDIISYTFYQGSTTTDLRVTLVWMDPVGWMATMKQVLHDLDLTVEDPSGKVWLANNRTWKGTTDELNNVEKVLIDDAVEGWYTINVTAHALLYNTQKYALAVSGNGWVTDVSTSSYNATDVYQCEDIQTYDGQSCSTLSAEDCCNYYGPTDWQSNTSTPLPGYCDKTCGFCFTNDDAGCYGNSTYDDDDDNGVKGLSAGVLIAIIVCSSIFGACILGIGAAFAWQMWVKNSSAQKASATGDFPADAAAKKEATGQVIEAEMA